MKNKIEQFLVIMLAMIAVLLLLATGSREESAPTETVPTGTTEQTAPPQTTSAPAASLGDGPRRVEEVLMSSRLDETAMGQCVYDADLNGSENTAGAGKKAMGYTLAGLCDEQRMNPIAAFWLLVEEGLYEKSPDASGKLNVPASDRPDREKRTYAYSAEGARELLTDLLTAAGEISDGLSIESKLLGTSGAVAKSRVFEAPGDCYYAYFVCYGDRTAHILCFYLRGTETITDVEFQLLNLRYASGDAEELEQLTQHGDRQAAALMTAAELLMTGKTRAAEGKVPFSYEVKDFNASIERFTFTADGEDGTLTNYRLRSKE